MRFSVCNVAFAALFSTGGLALGGGQAAQGGASGAVAGSVAVRQSGQPVPGAVVSLEAPASRPCPTRQADSESIGCPPGSVMLVVRAPGFLDAHVGAVQVRAGDTAPIDVELDTTPNFMERVQVTATKTPLSIGDVAAQADIVDRATIESRGDQTLTQAIATSRASSSARSSASSSRVMLRGMPRGDHEFTNTLLLIDGVPQANSGNGARVVGLTINDASSIEVVRGPNSALCTAAPRSAARSTCGPPNPTAEAGVQRRVHGRSVRDAQGRGRVSGPVRELGRLLRLGRQGAEQRLLQRTRPADDYSDGNTAVLRQADVRAERESFGSVSVNHVDSDNSTPTNEPIIDGQLLHEHRPAVRSVLELQHPGSELQPGREPADVQLHRQLSPSARIVEVFGYRDVLQQFIDDGDFIGSPFDLRRIP